MVFSELYSAYYNTVAKILKEAVKGDLTQAKIHGLVEEHAFSESVLSIVPALREERWQLLRQDHSTPLQHEPTMPLTTLEKQWLRSILSDPRMKLFGVTDEGLEDVEPLFTQDAYRVFDRYADGDPYEDETYIRNFRLVLSAIRAQRPLEVTLRNRRGQEVWVRFQPVQLEYSEKDDKFRVVATGCRYSHFNLARFIRCEYYMGRGPWKQTPAEDPLCEVELEILDERNTMERAMLHFAHFEKQAEKLDERRYVLRIRYYKSDETEMLIRVLSFGPYVRAVAPESFVQRIRERLMMQKSCGLE